MVGNDKMCQSVVSQNGAVAISLVPVDSDAGRLNLRERKTTSSSSPRLVGLSTRFSTLICCVLRGGF